MKRRIAICLTLGILGVACSYAQTQEPNGVQAESKIGVLRKQRIELLQHRVSQIEQFIKRGFVNRTDLIKAQIDLLNARLDYARSDAEKKKWLTDLLKRYDDLIEITEFTLKSPPSPRTKPHNLAAVSQLLFLKSERVRIQIEREILD